MKKSKSRDLGKLKRFEQRISDAEALGPGHPSARKILLVCIYILKFKVQWSCY